MDEQERAIVARCVTPGRSRDQIVDAIVSELPRMHRLKAHRLAEGWTRVQLSQAIDRLYVSDGLRPPHLRTSEICNWEHGRRRPNPERQEYLCRVYRTRPDRVGFGTDYTWTVGGRP